MTSMINIDPKTVVKDPLASCNIPQIIEDKKLDIDGKATTYKRGSLLGKGGFAKVFCGTLLPGNTQYALKIVAKASLLKVRAQQKLQTEIKIHKSLRHVNVVKFERFFDDPNYYYIVMELCDYNSMSELIKRRKKLSEPETRYYLIQIVESLKYLHSNLVIHRDLKLGNLFIDGSMRIKVGDFGLATKLTFFDERRKTVCGTPNYIAPEILDGKTGHSFEVDVWSTGVIMYTLLVGKPPFESKDVKSTYKRILANSYSFPDQSYVGADAKNLIRKILQTRPELRPSLNQIAEHPFFTSAFVYTPLLLPDSALHECPKNMMTPNESAVSASTSTDLVSHKSDNTEYVPVIGNENDPNAMNRIASSSNKVYSSTSNFVLKKDSIPVVNSNTALRSIAPSLKSTALSTNNNNVITQAAYNHSGSITTTGNRILTLRNPERQLITTSSSGVTSKESSIVPLERSKSLQLQQQQQVTSSKPGPRGSITNNVQTTTTYSQKFDIFVDTKAPQTTYQQQVGRKRESSTVLTSTGSSVNSDLYNANVNKDTIANKRTVTLESVQVTATSSSPQKQLIGLTKKGYDEFEIDKMQVDLQHVHIVEKNRLNQLKTAPVEAWKWNDDNQMKVSNTNNATAITTRSNQPPQIDTPHHLQNTAMNCEPARMSEPMSISTPQDQIRSSKEIKQLGTLETMHEMLNNSFSVVDQYMNSASANLKSRWSQEHEVEGLSDNNPFLAAKVWVVRYVDYTSKYGLGFLFNTGSAGVFFNDSTKIVLSADGTVFQYTERRRRDSSLGSEHSSQKHLIISYPPELQKKVTLLKHFRNYLIDQQKNGVKTTLTNENELGLNNDQPPVINKNMNMKDIGAIEGACPYIKFGQSSTKYKSVDENNNREVNTNIFPDSPTSGLGSGLDDDDIDMPFLKKWVRTKHAILFRISNRTVQVVFYDRSEILLSSEARVITYVSKLGQRSEYSLDDVMTSGRLDIAKRLKYTKDIMYRLINTQSK